MLFLSLSFSTLCCHLCLDWSATKQKVTLVKRAFWSQNGRTCASLVQWSSSDYGSGFSVLPSEGRGRINLNVLLCCFVAALLHQKHFNFSAVPLCSVVEPPSHCECLWIFFFHSCTVVTSLEMRTGTFIYFLKTWKVSSVHFNLPSSCESIKFKHCLNL